ncbi:MAG: hypothetical protein M3R24_15030 [Chloroflexota bacterium]|nr:hypothetical protein [Chloroflexota bacterium]
MLRTTADLLQRSRIDRPVCAAWRRDQPPKVVVFTGLPGSGKTTAAQQYLAHIEHPIIMLDLANRRNHRWSILRPLLEHHGLPTARPHAALARITTPTVLVLDHVEVALDPDGVLGTGLSTWLPAVLHHPALRVVLISAVMPVHPALSDLLARGQVQIIDGAALAFTPEDAQEMWRLHQGTALDDACAERLVAHTGGLAAAITLACTLGWTPEQEWSLVLQHLMPQLLRDLPAHLREVLIETAMFDTLTPTRVAQLTNRADGAALLQQLRQHGVVSAPPSAAAVHPLVRAAALEHLRRDPARLEAQNARAIAYELDEQHFAAAWSIAVAAHLWTEARSVIVRAAPSLRAAGQAQTLISWIEMLPPPVKDHEITVLLARCQGDVGDFDGAVLTLTTARARTADPHEQRELTIWLAALKQVHGEIQGADALIRPYLADPSLPLLWRARILRIHAVACAHAGDDTGALHWIAQSIAAAEAAGERRLLALAYGDQATIAGRLGRFTEAEQALRLAERCWRDLQSSADLTVTLNARAMLLLAQHRCDEAASAALQSRAHALAADRVRDAAVASATCGDIAFAQHTVAEALQHYQVAAEDADTSGYRSLRAYAWTMQAHIARLGCDHAAAAALLPRLIRTDVESVEHAGWRASGVLAAQLTLGISPSVAAAEAALNTVSDDMEDVRVALLATLVHAYTATGNSAAAERTWEALENNSALQHAQIVSRLAPLFPSRHTETNAAHPQHALAVGSDRALAPTVGASPRAPVLQMRLCGVKEQIRWHNQPVTIPTLGVALLLLLMTAAAPLDEAQLRTSLWGVDNAGPYALRKLVTRVHAVMPEIVSRRDGRYTVTLSPQERDIDLLTLLEMNLQATETERLLAVAEMASVGFLLRHTSPWADEFRQRVNRRLGQAWLEIGRRAEAADTSLAAHDAYERALAADPASDLVARAVLSHAQQRGDRTLLMERYRQHREALDLLWGVEPAHDVEALYRAALEP